MRSQRSPGLSTNGPLNELLGLFRYVADVLVPAHSITQGERVDGSEAFSKHSQAAVLMARLLKAWPDEMLLVLADLSSSDGEDAPTVLSEKEFNAYYRRVMETALEPRSLCLNVPSFFKQAMQQFRDGHCISVSIAEAANPFCPPNLLAETEQNIRAGQ